MASNKDNSDGGRYTKGFKWIKSGKSSNFDKKETIDSSLKKVLGLVVETNDAVELYRQIVKEEEQKLVKEQEELSERISSHKVQMKEERQKMKTEKLKMEKALSDHESKLEESRSKIRNESQDMADKLFVHNRQMESSKADLETKTAQHKQTLAKKVQDSNDCLEILLKRVKEQEEEQKTLAKEESKNRITQFKLELEREVKTKMDKIKQDVKTIRLKLSHKIQKLYKRKRAETEVTDVASNSRTPMKIGSMKPSKTDHDLPPVLKKQRNHGDLWPIDVKLEKEATSNISWMNDFELNTTIQHEATTGRSKINRTCALCSKRVPKEKVILCGGCGRRAYCSETCQHTDWKVSNNGNLEDPMGQGHQKWCGVDYGEQDLDWEIVPQTDVKEGVVGTGKGLVALRDLPTLYRITVGGLDLKKRVRCYNVTSTKIPNASFVNKNSYLEQYNAMILISEKPIKKGEEILRAFCNREIYFRAEQMYEARTDELELKKVAMNKLPGLPGKEEVIQILAEELGMDGTSLMQEGYAEAVRTAWCDIRDGLTKNTKDTITKGKTYLQKRIDFLAKVGHPTDVVLTSLRQKLADFETLY